ncbi:MAG: flagellar hook capping protein [Planctomycetota bacterium]|nr:MAG: flagellar hook capping protein [Planctomycetota bacterium]
MQINGLTSALSGNEAMQETLDREAFLQLLVTQLKNQSPLDPVKNEDFIAQLAQFSQLENSEAMGRNLRDLVGLQQLSQGAALVGKEVDYLDPASGDERSGRVSGVEVVSGEARLVVDGSTLSLQDLRGVREAAA